jgi:hypothetical protein
VCGGGGRGVVHSPLNSLLISQQPRQNLRLRLEIARQLAHLMVVEKVHRDVWHKWVRVVVFVQNWRTRKFRTKEISLLINTIHSKIKQLNTSRVATLSFCWANFSWRATRRRRSKD